jgi:chromosome segregation ATPase
MAGQLESERQERKRLEARVLALTEQLKQLHVQLQSNLESENIFQKRVNECEEAVRLAEQGKAEAEAAIEEREKEREQVELEFTEFKAAQERFEEERKCAQQEWLVKLEASLIALKESDGRVAKELEARRSIQATLQGLKEDFRVQVGRALEFHHEPVKPAAKPAAEPEAQPA